jgi:hypothetical protein
MGLTRIQGVLTSLSHMVERGTVSKVWRRNGIEPAPGRRKRTTGSLTQSTRAAESSTTFLYLS